MSPTIEVGNLIVVDEQPRDFTPTRTGEVVVFRGPASDGVRGSPQSTLVKRVIGLPGRRSNPRATPSISTASR
jgi:signal peptidase I